MGLGAFLSSVDLGTDVYVVHKYYSEGLYDKGLAMLIMIGTNMFLQIVLVMGQYRKKKWTLKVRTLFLPHLSLLFARFISIFVPCS